MPQQLHRLAGADFALVRHWTKRFGLEKLAAESLPLIRWPNGSWCLEGNLYFSHLLRKGLRLGPRGGSIGTYAFYLSHLLRQMNDLNKDFSNYEDHHFVELLTHLYDEGLANASEDLARDRTTVHSIATRILDFLAFVGEFRGIKDYVSPTGQIRGERIERAGKFGMPTWDHWALGESDPYNFRPPLSERSITLLRLAAAQRRQSPFNRKRRLVMLELFDTLGLRRVEASWLLVRDVRDAIAEWKHSLSSRTPLFPSDLIFTLAFRMAKKSDPSATRKVPISAVTLQFFEEYLSARERAAKKAGLSDQEYGLDSPFFINLRKGKNFGKAFTPNFFTLEFSFLGKSVQVRPCSPHMVRTRFIVREFIRLVHAHHLSNSDEFRRALQSDDSLKRKVMQITGHSSEASVDVYLHFAYDEITSFAQTQSAVDAQRGREAVDAAHQRFLVRLASGERAASAIQDLLASVETFLGRRPS